MKKKKSVENLLPSFLDKENLKVQENEDEIIGNEIILVKPLNKIVKRKSIDENNIIRKPFGPTKENFKNINGRRIIPRIFSV